MALVGVKCVLGHVKLDDHRRCMVEQPGPPCGIEPSILEMIVRPNMEREESGVIYSPSSIQSCHRRDALASDHDYYIDVRASYKQVRGTIVHQGMSQELAYPGVLGVVRELRMGSPINTRYGERTFHGKPDLVVLERVQQTQVVEYDENENPYNSFWKNILYVKIVDYKTTSEVRHDLVAPDRRHVYQINEYAWLVQRFLPGWLNNRLVPFEDDAFGTIDHSNLQLSKGVTIPHIDEVVVDELSIIYMDMKKLRTFTSRGFLTDQGKMLSDYVNGHWIRRNPPEYEELELEPVHQFRPSYTESLIRKGIEEQIEAETLLAPPLEGDDARLMCGSCPVKQACIELGLREGYSMKDQLATWT